MIHAQSERGQHIRPAVSLVVIPAALISAQTGVGVVRDVGGVMGCKNPREILLTRVFKLAE